MTIFFAAPVSYKICISPMQDNAAKWELLKMFSLSPLPCLQIHDVMRITWLTVYILRMRRVNPRIDIIMRNPEINNNSETHDLFPHIITKQKAEIKSLYSFIHILFVQHWIIVFSHEIIQIWILDFWWNWIRLDTCNWEIRLRNYRRTKNLSMSFNNVYTCHPVFKWLNNQQCFRMIIHIYSLILLRSKRRKWKLPALYVTFYFVKI